MHLWPSTRIRESFKHAYITKLEWNLHRMRIQKYQQQSSNKQNLLDKEQGSAAAAVGDSTEATDSVSRGSRVLDFCSDVLLYFSCCYCCYCCGACLPEEH